MALSQENVATQEELVLADAIVAALNLDIPPENIQPEAPLYGNSMGLDSIDMLEIALMLSRNYGCQLRADEADNQHIFSSLRALNQYVQAHRTA